MCVYINKAKGEFFILDKMVRDFIFSMKTFINLTIKILLVNQIYLIFIIQVYVKQNWLLFFIFLISYESFWIDYWLRMLT